MLHFTTPDGDALTFQPQRLLIAGWTGRDAAKIAEHIEELAAIGVAPPSTTPLYYQAPATTLTQAAAIEVIGGDTGGEAEAVLFDDGATLWLGLGSDHTDRDLERFCVARSKAVCPKPLAGEVWRFETIADRLDDLRIVSEASEDGESWTPYQDGALGALQPIPTLAGGAPAAQNGRLGAGAAMFCGALAAQGGVRPTPYFRARLEDPATGRAIQLSYQSATLPVVR